MSVAREQRTLIRMFHIHCRADHKSCGRLCGECSALLEYSQQRLAFCPYGDQKPSCKQCTVHCYRVDEREAVCSVMRLAGPRMLWHHPVMAVRHLIKEKRRLAVNS